MSGGRWTAGQALLLGLICTLGGLVARVGYVQHCLGPRLLARAERQYRSRTILPARRGMILDARGRILAGTVLQPCIFADPQVIQDLPTVARRLAPVLGCHPAVLLEKLRAHRRRRYVVLQRRASAAQAEQIERLDIFGIGVQQLPRRVYPMGALAAHVLGFVGSDGHGLEGLELAFERVLAGREGFKVTLCDARRRSVWLARDGYRRPKDGLSLLLTLDATIQEIAERHLRRTVERFKAQSGSVVVMEPATGQVLALANWPSYDPNRPEDYPQPALRNRAVTDPLEPGSTFKPFIAAAALADGVARLNEVFWCHEGYYAAARLHDHRPHGYLSFREVVIRSSNIGMALLGERLGQERLYEICRRFGFGRPTGIDLPGESGGLLRPVESWSRPDTTRVTMGQGPVAATAVQMIRAFCALVNGGKLLRPRVVRAVVDEAGRVVEDRSRPVVVGRPIDEATAWRFSRDVLAEVVRVGTGWRARLGRWQVVGKTGTGQVVRPGGGYEPGGFVSSFVGAAPGSRPRVAVLVMIYRPDPSLGYFGGTVAAPAVRQILGETLGYLGVESDRGGGDGLVWVGRDGGREAPGVR